MKGKLNSDGTIEGTIRGIGDGANIRPHPWQPKIFDNMQTLVPESDEEVTSIFASSPLSSSNSKK